MKIFKNIVLMLTTISLIFGFCGNLKADETTLPCSGRAIGETCTLSEVDGASLENFGGYYKDKYHVYYHDEITPDPNINYIEGYKIISNDPANFVSLDNCFAKDCLNVIFYNTNFDADANSFSVLNTSDKACGGLSKDKNKVYASRVVAHNHDEFGFTYEVTKVDPATVSIIKIGENYIRDKNGYYYVPAVYNVTEMAPTKLSGIDIKTFQVLDDGFAIDKYNMYDEGKKMSKAGEKIKNNNLYARLKGKILIKTEDYGAAYYISPNKKEMYSLYVPMVAFNVMRNQGVGISNANLYKIPVAGACPAYMTDCDQQDKYDLNFANQQKGRIFIQIEASGEAWYVNPNNSKRYFLGRPADAYNVMKTLGLGITNKDFNSLSQ